MRIFSFTAKFPAIAFCLKCVLDIGIYEMVSVFPNRLRCLMVRPDRNILDGLEGGVRVGRTSKNALLAIITEEDGRGRHARYGFICKPRETASPVRTKDWLARTGILAKG